MERNNEMQPFAQAEQDYSQHQLYEITPEEFEQLADLTDELRAEYEALQPGGESMSVLYEESGAKLYAQKNTDGTLSCWVSSKAESGKDISEVADDLMRPLSPRDETIH